MTVKNFSVDDLKKILNPAQLDAVTSIEGPVLVVAGAGTGKTRVIEYRCCHMVQQGIPPENILLLTFTRKASREMLGRACLHSELCRRIEGGTFHSFAYRIIKTYKKFLGLGDQLSFLDESDSGDILHLLAEKLGFLEEKTRFPKKDTVRQILSMSINRSQTIVDILGRDYPHFSQFHPHLEELRKKYAEYKIARDLIDYDDMLIYLRLLLQQPEIQKNVTQRYRYVMVDEFQDTNRIQADIVYALARDHHNCLAVGDDTQSIYSFRGAYYKNMFNFPKVFADTKIIKLEYNYRSIQPILDVANAVIEGESQKYAKVLYALSPGDEQPTLSYFKDAYTEAEWVASRIKDYHDDGIPLGSMGVLYRSNFLSLPVQLALSKLNIPFAVFGGMKFIETAHIKDTMAFLKAHHNAKDEVSLARILQLHEGVGPKTAEKIKSAILATPPQQLDEVLKELIKSQAMRQNLVSLGRLFAALNQTAPIGEKIAKIIEYYTPILKKKFDDYPLRQDDLKAFAEISSSYISLEQLLVDFVTIEPPERSAAGVDGRVEDERPVTLSTVHSAKGLEWDVVFLIALVDGSLPVSYAVNDPESLEEERRLLYVAVTRAKRHLHLSMHNEGRNGGMHSFNRLSRFISEPRVLQKLKTDYAWFDEPDIPSQDVSSPGMDKQGLYRRLVDYLDSPDGQDYF